MIRVDKFQHCRIYKLPDDVVECCFAGIPVEINLSEFHALTRKPNNPNVITENGSQEERSNATITGRRPEQV